MALAATLGSDTLQLINKSRVLVVGAGGIGCELLKNLVSSGFRDIETIDLDTIEVSNLNRQFLFRKCHVGKSKAKTASAAVKKFDDAVSVIGHLGNIKSQEFNSEYFDKFDIVLNALDNTEARRHVNRLCLSTSKSFVESGTQGFLGQVIPIIPKYSQCWECTPKQSNQKTYPVCTIRSTPDKPVHCIVWAKLIYQLLFGQNDDSNIIKDLKVEKKDDEKNEEFVKNTFIHLFEKDIEEQLSMEDKWKNRKPPITIKYNEMEKKINELQKNGEQKIDTMKVMSLEENVLNFINKFNELLIKKREHNELVFDKDDNLAMSFVASAANLRMHCYSIETQSEFAVKGIAGNIIHAIATTNAIVAGAMVVQAIHILRRNDSLKNKKEENKEEAKSETNGLQQRENQLKQEQCKVCWVQNTGKKWLYPQNMEGPNSKCFICQKSVVHLTLNPKLFNFGAFVKKILCKNLGFKQPDITLECVDPNDNNKKVSNYIESIAEDDDESEKKQKAESLPKALDDPMIKIYNDSSLSIEDFSQDVNVNLKIHYLDLDEEKHPNGFEITNDWSLTKFKVAEKKEQEEKKEENGDDKSKNKEKNGETKKIKNKFIGKKRKTMDGVNGKGKMSKDDITQPPLKKLKKAETLKTAEKLKTDKTLKTAETCS